MNDKTMKEPLIRFDGFTGDWVQDTLGNLADIFDGTHQTPQYTDFGVKFVSVENIATLETNKYISQDAYEKEYSKKPVEKGDILMTRIGDVGTARLVLTSEPLAYYVTLALLKPKDVEPHFLVWRISSPQVQKDIWKRTLHIAFPKKINLGEINQVQLVLPALPEQTAIGSFFSTLDSCIEINQRRLDLTKKYKEAMLQKMFPKNGEVVPEVRFDGFANAWEQRKLGDVIEKLNGGASIEPNDYQKIGIRTIPKGAVNESGVANLSGSKFISSDFYKRNIASSVSSMELVTSLRDLVPSAPNMGRIVRIVSSPEDFLMPQGVYSLKLKLDMDEDFLIAYSNTEKYRRIISAEKNGSTQVHIRNGEFLNINIPLPRYKEQAAIGLFFSTLDRTITFHQRELELLKQVKKSLLQKMFI